jgi:hypothetical protein
MKKKEFKIKIEVKPIHFLRKEVNIILEDFYWFYLEDDLFYIANFLKEKYGFNFNNTIGNNTISFHFLIPNNKLNDFKKDIKKMFKLLEKKSKGKNHSYTEIIKVKLPIKIK